MAADHRRRVGPETPDPGRGVSGLRALPDESADVIQARFASAATLLAEPGVANADAPAPTVDGWEPETRPPSSPTMPAVRLMSGADFLRLPAPVELVEGVLLDRGTTFVTSRFSGGKSALALSLAFAVAGGLEQWMEHGVLRHGHVIYLVAESQHGLSARYARLLEAAGRPEDPYPRLHFVTSPVPFMHPRAADAVLAAIAAAGIPLDEVVLFVVDTWHRTGAGAEENNNDHVRDRLATAARIVDATGCAMVVLAHPGKGREDTRGGGSAEDDADAVIRLERESVDAPLVTVKCAKLRDAEPFAPWVFRLDRGLAVPVTREEAAAARADAALAPGSVGRAVLVALATGPKTNKELVDVGRQAGVRDRTVKGVLPALESKRLITPPPRVTRTDGRTQAIRGGRYTLTAGGEELVRGWGTA